jgi:mycoredoxin
MAESIVMYTSRFCFHSQSVERFFKSQSIPVEYINIDGNQEARENLMAINRGYASVPTLLFPDGTQLTEPSLGEIKSKLGIEVPGLIDRLKRVVGK